MSIVAGSVGFVLSALIAGCLFVCWWQEADRVDDLADELDRNLREHDKQLDRIRGDLAALCDFLGVDVNSEDAPDDWAEQEPQTDEFPAATEPMTAVPARVEDVPLAKVSAEIERDGRVDEATAWALADLEDRIYEWRRKQAMRRAG